MPKDSSYDLAGELARGMDEVVGVATAEQVDLKEQRATQADSARSNAIQESERIRREAQTFKNAAVSDGGR